MKRLQLEDLSKQLGYSKTLISMVLNGKGDQYGINKKTQASVLEAATALNYIPNKFAKALRTGKSYFVGLIVTDIANPFYAAIAKTIEKVLFEAGYTLMVCSNEENEDKEKQLVEMMLQQQSLDGLIIASTFKNAAFYEQAFYTNMPIVFIERIIPLYNNNYVVSDNYGGSLEIVQFLLKLGCKKIACFRVTPLHLSTAEDRINGYKDALIKNKIAEEPDLIKDIRYDCVDEDVEKSLFELTALTNPPDAIFVLNSSIAVSLLKHLKQVTFSRYTSNVRVACFDDLEIFDLLDTPPVISVRQAVQDIGKNASQILLNIIAGKQNKKSNVVLATSLIER